MLLPNKTLVLALGLLHVLAGLAVYVSGQTAALDVYVRSAGMLLAHAIAAALCCAIARDYPTGSLLRTAWILFAGESFCMGSRSLIQLAGIQFGNYQREMLSGLITLGALFMITGMITTGYALRRMGFTFELYRRDVLAMLGVASILPVVLVQRWGWPPALDWSAGPPIVISLTAIVSIPLVRFSRQMENALLARTYVWIVTYMTVRCFFHLLSAMQISGFGAGTALDLLRYMIGYGAAWLFAWAAALRYEPVRAVNRQLVDMSAVRRAASPAR